VLSIWQTKPEKGKGQSFYSMYNIPLPKDYDIFIGLSNLLRIRKLLLQPYRKEERGCVSGG